MQNQIFDAINHLSSATTSAQKWTAAKGVLSAFGADWVTGGTAPARHLASLSVQTSTPDSLMRDYVSEKLYLRDPWLHYCVRSPDVNEISPQTTDPGAVDRVDGRLAGLFADHGVRHVCMVPSWAGPRVGALVLYATTADSAEALRCSDQRQQMKTMTALVAAFWQPHQMTDSGPERYRIGETLSPREKEALLWLSTGLRTAAIAHRMGIESVTVSKHFDSARRKLNARTREQTLAIVIRDGLIQV